MSNIRPEKLDHTPSGLLSRNMFRLQMAARDVSFPQTQDTCLFHKHKTGMKSCFQVPMLCGIYPRVRTGTVHAAVAVRGVHTCGVFPLVHCAHVRDPSQGKVPEPEQ